MFIKKDSHSDITSNNINLLTDDLAAPRGKKLFKVSRFLLYLFIILVIGLIVFSYQVVSTNSSISNVFGGKINIFKQLTGWTQDGGKLKGETEDRINIMLLGIGGEGHDGPYLTDTIILLSLKPSTKKVAMVSIPRDLYVNIPGNGYGKINAANAWGEKADPGNGAKLANQVVSEVLNEPINYYLRVDFAGFEKIIDDVGGVKIYVDRAFTDTLYPTLDHKYQILTFEQGWQTMDGATALKYVRSRHGNNGENSDFARSKRQQKVIQALKERVLSYDFLLSPKKITTVSKELANHLKTDMEPWEVLKLAQSLVNFDTTNIINKVIDDSPNGFLYSGYVNEAYVLQPKGGSFEPIQKMVDDVFNTPVNTDSINQTTPKEPIKIEIRNGTKITGLASKSSDALKLNGYEIGTVTNAPEQNYQSTIIYKISKDPFDNEQKFLEDKYSTKIQTENIPVWVTNSAAPDTDFFIILGPDANK